MGRENIDTRKPRRTDEAAALPITAGYVVRPAQEVLRPPPAPTRPAIHFPVQPVIGRHAPAVDPQAAGPGRASQFPPPPSIRSAPIRRGVPHGCASRLFTASMAFTLNSGARHSLHPPLQAGLLTTPQASRHATDRIVAPPYRASDAGLRPGPFPGRAASLLPGLLAATRTGLPPAGDDELTNTKKHHGITSRCHLPALLGARMIEVSTSTRHDQRANDGDMDGIAATRLLVEIVEKLWHTLIEIRQGDRELAARLYETSIAPSFQTLEDIHKDYVRNLTRLRDQLRMQTIPPQELLLWLHGAGLEYRSNREKLSTIEASLRGLGSKELSKLEKHCSHFLSKLRQYIAAVLDYLRATNSIDGRTFYRGLESQLEAVLKERVTPPSSVPDSSALDQFYSHPEVSRLAAQLKQICDERLPQYWMSVCAAFNELQASSFSLRQR